MVGAGSDSIVQGIPSIFGPSRRCKSAKDGYGHRGRFDRRLSERRFDFRKYGRDVAWTALTPVTNGERPIVETVAMVGSLDSHWIVSFATRTMLPTASVAGAPICTVPPTPTVAELGTIVSAVTVEPIVTEDGVFALAAMVTLPMPDA